ncbi:MAG: hypothetical protein RSD08_02170 [Oscillospiraceae bacterium]
MLSEISPRKHVKLNNIMLLAAFAVGCAAYYFIPMAFAPDSYGYIQSALSFFNDGSFAGWDSFRGPLIPLIMSASFHVFGVTRIAVKFTFFLFYLIMFFSVYSLMNTLGLFKKNASAATWLLFVFALLLNPCVMAYGHLCLAEFPAVACLAAYAALMARIYLEPDQKQRYVHSFLLKLIVVCVFTVLTYSIKQAAFAIVPALFAMCELLSLIKHFKLKKLLAAITVIVIAAASLLGYVKLWSGLTGGENVEGESVTAFAGTFIVDGLRYFRVTERGVYDRPITIEIMSRDYETVKKSFEYTFTNSLADSAKYFFRCLAESPADVFRSYRENYLLITGSRHLLGTDGAERAYGRVNSTTEFFTGQETAAWTDAFAQIEPESGGCFYMTSDSLNDEEVFDHIAYNNSFARRLLFNSVYRKLAYFQYSFITFNAPAVGIISLVLFLCGRKRGKNELVHQINFVCAFTIFLQIMFLAITAQSIDRYGFPLVIFCFLIVVNSVYNLLSLIADRNHKSSSENNSQSRETSCTVEV